METRKDYPLVLSYFVIISIIALIIFMAVMFILNENSKIEHYNRFYLDRDHSDTVSLNLYNTHIDSFKFKIDALQKEVIALQEIRGEIMNLKEDERFYTKLYTSLLALILALAGFFGFKSISDTKKESIERAENKAREAAEKKSEELIEAKFVIVSNKLKIDNLRIIEENSESTKKTIKELNERIEYIERPDALTMKSSFKTERNVSFENDEEVEEFDTKSINLGNDYFTNEIEDASKKTVDSLDVNKKKYKKEKNKKLKQKNN